MIQQSKWPFAIVTKFEVDNTRLPPKNERKSKLYF